jgi:hypothetical protein
MTLDERIEAAKKKKSSAEAAFTDADRAEQAKRDVLAKLEAETRIASIAKRDLDIARRLDAAREDLDDDVRICDVIIEGTDHTFIVKDPGAKAYNTWEKDIKRSQQKGSGVDSVQTTRALALVSVHDWNGISGDEAWKALAADGEGTNGSKLVELLKKSPGIATILCNEATTLAGLSREDRKSAG